MSHEPGEPRTHGPSMAGGPPSRSAAAPAGRLERQDRVSRVTDPGQPSHSQAAIAARQR